MADQKDKSLWELIPWSTKRELIPILTTGFLAQSGALTAELLVRLREGAPPDQHSQAVSDVNGIFILLNFVVIFWFGYVTLKEAVDKGGEISLNAKLIGLGSAFVTSLELYSYALKSGQPGRLAYTLVVLFYVFVIPFFLVRQLESGEQEPQPAVRALAAYELVVYALIAGAATVIGGSLYFVVLNDGGRLLGQDLFRAFVTSLSQHGRAEFWGVSPGILGLGWLLAVFLSATVFTAKWGKFGPDRNGKHRILAGAVLVNILIGMALIGNTSIAPVDGVSAVTLNALKGWLAIFMTAAFLLAFVGAGALWRTAPRGVAIGGGLTCFAIAGAALGGMLILIRSRLGDTSPANLHLIWMHAGGFTIAYVCGFFAMKRMARLLPEVRAPFPSDVQPAGNAS